MYSSLVYSSLTGVSCLWSRRCKDRRYLEIAAATLTWNACTRAFRARIFASIFYSRDIAHVAPDYTILSLFWLEWFFFIYTKKKLLSDRCKPVQLPLPCFFLFFSYHYRWVYVKSSWSSLHAVMMSLWDFSFLCFTQRTALASTLRHIGEELYKPQVKCLIICWYRPLNSLYAVTVSVFIPISPCSLYRLFTGSLPALLVYPFAFICLLFFAASTHSSSSFTFKKEVQLVSAVEACLWYTNVWVLTEKPSF